jgi:hypothetical protein
MDRRIQDNDSAGARRGGNEREAIQYLEKILGQMLLDIIAATALLFRPAHEARYFLSASRSSKNNRASSMAIR